jgi:DNA-binding transcriptional LysR family regulator
MNTHDIKTLRLFVACCELQSLSKAAADLHMAPSAASRRIRLLEESAKVPLLARRPHGVEPTAAGLTVLHYARDVLHLTYQTAGLVTEHLSGLRGYVRISAAAAVMLGRLAADLSAFAVQSPEIKVDLEQRATPGALDSLITKRVDICAVVAGVHTGDLETFAYGGDRLCVAVHQGHPLAERSRVKFADIVAYDLITFDSGTALRRLLANQAQFLGTHLKVRMQLTSFDVMGLMASKGLGIGILPESAVSPVSAAWALRLLELDEPWTERRFELCVRSAQALDPAASRLLSFLVEQSPSSKAGDDPRKTRRPPARRRR